MSRLAWGRLLDAGERAALRACARAVDCDPSHLSAVIMFESHWDPTTVNESYGASGLIQFVPSTATGMGTSVEAIRRMSRIEQLGLVQRYLMPYRGRIGTLSDLYMAVLRPTAIGKADDFALITSAEGKAYFANKGLDLNKDGNITKYEATEYVRRRLEEGLRDENATMEDRPREEVAQMDATTRQGIGGLLGMLHPAAGILFNVFAPALKQKLADKVDSASGTPGAGQALADALSEALLGSAKEQTGKTDDLEAVAVARQNPAYVEAAQSAAVVAVEERLKQLAPVLAQTVDWDKQKWQAEREGRDAASKRAIAEKKAGVWDMTRFLVCSLLIMLWGIAWGLLYMIYETASKEEVNQMVLAALIGLAGPIWTGAIVASVAAIVAYRFDGTKESSEQTKALTDVMRTNLQGG